MGVVEVLKTGVLVESKSGVVAALKVVVALMMGVVDAEMSAVLVNVKSVVTVPISELVVSRRIEDVDGVAADIALVVRADVNGVVVAIMGDSYNCGSVQSILEGCKMTDERVFAVVVGARLI